MYEHRIHRLILFKRRDIPRSYSIIEKVGSSNSDAQTSCVYEVVKQILLQDVARLLIIWMRRMGTNEGSDQHDRYL